MTAQDPQLLKGVLTLLLLTLLAETEDYGYSLGERLRGDGLSALAESTVYPALTRLERQGLLRSRLMASTSGPARKYYSSTQAGLQERETLQLSWAQLVLSVSLIISPKGKSHDELAEYSTPNRAPHSAYAAGLLARDALYTQKSR